MQICLLEAEKRTQDMIRIICRGAPYGKGIHQHSRRVKPLAGLSVKITVLSFKTIPIILVILRKTIIFAHSDA